MCSIGALSEEQYLSSQCGFWNKIISVRLRQAQIPKNVVPSEHGLSERSWAVGNTISSVQEFNKASQHLFETLGPERQSII